MADQATTAATDVVNKSDYDKVLEKARREEARAVDFEKRFAGIDPDKYRAEREELEILKREKAGGDPKQIDALIAAKVSEVENRFSTKLTDYEKRAIAAEQKNRHLEVVNPALSFLGPQCTADGIKLLEPLIGSELGIVDGKIIAIDKEGNPVPSKKDPRQKTMDLSEYAEDLKARYPSTFKSDIPAGGRSAGEVIKGGNLGDLDVAKFKNLTPEQRASLPRETRDKLVAQFFK